MKKIIAGILSIFLCTLIFTSCLNRGRGDPTISVTQPISTAANAQNTEPASQQTSDVTEIITSQTEFATSGVPDNQQTEPASADADANGKKMVFSSDPQNAFISAVVAKYSVDASNLVAYYVSGGDSNGNLVFEFDGTVGSDGRRLRTRDTLKNIYTVSPPPELIAKKASGTAAEGNEYNERDTKLCRYFTDYVLFRFFADDIQNA